jgi:hypothetical protein
MADYPGRLATSPLTILMFPGASIMKIERRSHDVLIVTCPGCGASQTFGPGPMQMAPTFLHETDDCPILKRIEAALDRLQMASRAETN